jgi:4-hydroxyphenylacetate 3-monooxygenase
MPRSYEELVERRRAIEAWCELHHGYLGRSPDHVASSMAGLAMGSALFRDYDPARAGALEDYYRYARDRDLFIAYTLINPQADKSKQAHEQQDQFLALRLSSTPRRTSRSKPMSSRTSSSPCGSWTRTATASS